MKYPPIKVTRDEADPNRVNVEMAVPMVWFEAKPGEPLPVSAVWFTSTALWHYGLELERQVALDLSITPSASLDGFPVGYDTEADACAVAIEAMRRTGLQIWVHGPGQAGFVPGTDITLL